MAVGFAGGGSGTGTPADGSITPAKLSFDPATQAELDNVASAKQNADADLTAIAALAPTNDDVLQRKAGAWTNRSAAQVKSDLVLVKGDVGLGNVDNTTDAGKPVSTAQQTALNLKANIASPTFTGVPAAPTAAPGTSTTQLATTAHVQGEVTVKSGRVRRTTTTVVLNTTPQVLTFDTEDEDTDTMVNLTDTVALTGTVAKAAASATLTGTGTSFTTELQVGQSITVPGTANETRRVTAIGSNTSLTVDTNFSNTASGQTAVRLLNDRITAKTAGIFLPTVLMQWPSSGSGYKAHWLQKGAGTAVSGSVVAQDDRAAFGSVNVMSITFKPLRMAVSDFVLLTIWQSNGSTITVPVGCEMHLTRMGA